MKDRQVTQTVGDYWRIAVGARTLARRYPTRESATLVRDALKVRGIKRLVLFNATHKVVGVE